MEDTGDGELPFYERLSSFLLLFSVLVVVGGSLFFRLSHPLFFLEEKGRVFRVAICGEVERPGFYDLEEGKCVGDLLRLAGELPLSDCSLLERERRVEFGDWIEVDKCASCFIFLEGAVEQEGWHEVARGGRLCHLERWVPLTADADRRWLRRRRKLLKQGERIQIPALSLPACVEVDEK